MKTTASRALAAVLFLNGVQFAFGGGSPVAASVGETPAMASINGAAWQAPLEHMFGVLKQIGVDMPSTLSLKNKVEPDSAQGNAVLVVGALAELAQSKKRPPVEALEAIHGDVARIREALQTQMKGEDLAYFDYSAQRLSNWIEEGHYFKAASLAKKMAAQLEPPSGDSRKN